MKNVISSLATINIKDKIFQKDWSLFLDGHNLIIAPTTYIDTVAANRINISSLEKVVDCFANSLMMTIKSKPKGSLH